MYFFLYPSRGGIGFYSIDLLPDNVLQQVNNLEGLGSVTAVFGGLIGTGLGLVVQTSYRRLEKQIKGTAARPTTDAVGRSGAGAADCQFDACAPLSAAHSF